MTDIQQRGDDPAAWPSGFRFKDLEAMWQGAVFFEDRRLWDFFRLPGE